MAQNMKRGRNQRRRSHSNNPNRALDSTGPDVKIRGTALQIYDKYQTLARDATSSGDRIRGESLLQHAEHYFRLMKAQQQQQQPQQQQQQQQSQQQQPQSAQDPAGEPQPEVAGGTSEAQSERVDGEGSAAEPVSEGKEAATAPAAVSEEPEKPKRTRRRRQPRKTASDEVEKGADESEVAAAE